MMSNLIQPIAFLTLVGYSVAFQSPGARHWPQSALASSYLDSLQPSSQAVAQSNAGSPPSHGVSTPPVEGADASGGATFSHAPVEYFGLEKLTPKGPRATPDWGHPQDSSRKLADDGSFRAGSWWCSEGGWPSPNPKGVTEVFYMLSGHGCLSDADGAKHYFGPGDTVVIPKGHTGRWDVFAPIHKVWAVNAHERIEETSDPIRVRVDHYRSFAPQHLTTNAGSDPLYRSTSTAISFRTFYDVGTTKVGVWTCGPGTIQVADGARSFFHLLEGVVFVTDGASGDARRCVAGDTFMLPAGWYGFIDVIETAKKLWTTAD